MTTSPQPIGDAVTTAFDDAEIQDVDPKLIAQITENVIKQLRQVNLEPKSAPSKTAGPSVEASNSPSNAVPSFSPPSRSENAQSATLDPSSATPSTTATGNSKTERYTEYGTRDAAPLSKQVSRDDSKSPSKPFVPQASSTLPEETPLERIWGTLFNENGYPTPRLGQLLRGLAVHLIEDCEPKHSIVITPSKMSKYYRESKLGNEYYPWHIIFDDEATYISRMYRELGCQHHLVQENHFERPEIPGLTPLGFSRWMTLMLMAHPDEESERLKSSIVNMPISNPDDRKERFPKDISKRLFPAKADVRSRNDLRRAIRKHCKDAKIDPPEDGDEPPGRSDSGLTDSFMSAAVPTRDPHGSHSETAEFPRVLPLERERQPYRASTGQAPTPDLSANKEKVPTVGPAGESAIADDDYTVPTQPIERERKPYYATPGSGKNYDEPKVGRNVYPVPTSTGGGSATFVPASSASSYPPPHQQNSAASSTTQAGLTRSNSNRSTTGRPGPPGTNHAEHGPPPAPSAGTAKPGPPPPEVHQGPRAGSRSRNGSFTRRRAPSGSRAYAADDVYPCFQPGSYDSHKPIYLQRSAGTDGYGADESAPRRARGASIGQTSAPPGHAGPSYVTEMHVPSGRRGSIERKRSPGKLDRTGGRDSPSRRSWAGSTGDEGYRDGGRY